MLEMMHCVIPCNLYDDKGDDVEMHRLCDVSR
jgi:hypothetical protein